MTPVGPPTRSFVLATAGHVDHGKSALVRALTGTDPDRLPEEKARGITIELGFARLSLATPAGPLEVGIVDVPGHEDFVRTMVAGVGPADAALLVVAADDGPMPQTLEHLEILAYAGVTRGVVALTKADLVADPAAVIATTRERLKGTPLADAPVVATSVRTGGGLDELKAALAAVLSGAPTPADMGRPRLAVDRVFSARGVGTVVTGTLVGGTLSRGQTVLVRPGGAASHVRGLQTFGRSVETAVPGSRVAVNLPDLAAAVAGRPSVARGDTVTVAGPAAPPIDVTVLDAKLWRVPDAAGTIPRDGTTPRDGTQVRLHHGTAAVAAKLRFRDAATLPAGGSSVARLTLARPLPVLLGDRFVLRADSGLSTLCGGIALDLNPPRRPAAAQARLLRARAACPDAVTFLATHVARDRIVDPARLACAGVPAAALAAATHALAADGTIIVAGTVVVATTDWTRWCDSAAAAVTTHHAAHPDARGLPLTALRALVLADTKAAGVVGRTDAVLAALVSRLERHGFARHGDTLAHAAHRPALPPSLRAAGDRLLRALAGRPFDPPSRAELCPTADAQQAMRFLIASAAVVEISADVVLSADAYAEAARKVRDYLAAGPAATVSELKTLLGSSRRVMVPLLERFDRDRVTRRNGNLRTAGDANRPT